MLDLTVVVIYLVFVLAFGVYNSASVKNADEFAKGSSYSAFIIFCTLTASYVGGGFTMGLAEKTFKFGFIFVIAILGFSLKEILIAIYIAPHMKYFQKNCATAGDIIANSFGKHAKIFTGFASVLVCGGVIGAQLATCGNIFESFLQIPSTIGVIATALIIISYVSFGGLKSVVKANVVHFLVLLSVIVTVFIIAMVDTGGISNLVNTTPEYYFSPIGNQNYYALGVLFLSFFFGETLVPPYVQRLLIGKSEHETKKGTFYSGVSSIFIFSMIGILGIVSFSLNPLLEPRFALPFAIETFLPSGARGFGIAAMLAIIMSSADAFMNATSMAVKKDIFEPIFGKPTDEKKDLTQSRIISFLIGCLATIFALSSTSILDLLLYSYQFWTPFILVPLFASIYRVKSSPKSFFISVICAFIALISWKIFFIDSELAEGSLDAVIAGISANLISFIIANKLIKPKKY